MRHQAGDDVVVVSRRSLTKSLRQPPVRPRSPGWTRSSSISCSETNHTGVRFYISFVPWTDQRNQPTLDYRGTRKDLVAEGGCCQPWGRVSGCCTHGVVHGEIVCFKDSWHGLS
ncbi:hypothetical protein WH47_02115 [Habropoda laboriosa]|uniref:Uncharacterized protein n=1 Tax=Habropoda laboriosa TaxID=597456 RepID=A0A0L7RJ53_9HYME|nr:hypothetical protein WH47_02115 [Habropoda laboriosa]